MGSVILRSIVGASLVIAACSGPREGLVSFSDRAVESAPDETEEEETPEPDNEETPAPPAQTVNPTFASDVYPALSGPCGACHLPGTGGAAIFFGADAAKSYPLFRAKNYHLPNSLLVTRGAHTGPALTEQQRAAVDNWIAAEGGGMQGDAGQ